MEGRCYAKAIRPQSETALRHEATKAVRICGRPLKATLDTCENLTVACRPDIDRLLKRMRELVDESRELAKRHEEVMQEHQRLAEELTQIQKRNEN